MPKTKIIATIGPVCDDKSKIAKLIKAGVNVFRLNLKHNSLRWSDTRIKRIREVSKELNAAIGIMVDLKGPELRVGKLKKGSLNLRKGEKVCLGRGAEIVFENISVLRELKKGERIFLDDGRIILKVIESSAGRKDFVKTEVVIGGVLYSNKGMNLPGVETSLPALSERDVKSLSLIKKHQPDFVALSFVREGRDMRSLKRVLDKEGINALAIAKIESQAAIENFEEILLEADSIMVARGDLGVELPIEEVPFWQKYIIERCLRAGKPVITATEMLSSMIEEERPTRAEVSDIANSVYDRADALLLSAETAIGKHPIQAVSVMKKTCEFIEKSLKPKKVKRQAYDRSSAVVFSAFNLVERSELPQPFTAFIVLTEEGKTVRLLSSLKPNLPIFAITPERSVQRQLSLSFGVESFYFDYRQDDVSKAVKSTVEFLRKKGKLKRGEWVVMIYGDDWRSPGRTNLVRIQEV